MRKLKPSRYPVRIWAFWLSSAILAFILSPVIGQWFVELAAEYGFYKRPSERLDGVVNWLTNLIGSIPFIILATLIVGVTIGLWVDWLLGQERVTRIFPSLRKERIKLEFAGHDPFVIYVPFHYVSNFQQYIATRKTVRIRATNLDKETLTGCRAVLFSISKKQEDGSWFEIFSDPIPLVWGFAESDPSGTVDIPPGSHHFILLVSAKDRTNEFQAHTTPQSLRLFNAIHESAVYRFGIRMNADNEIHSAPIFIDVDWQGNWNTLTALPAEAA